MHELGHFHNESPNNWILTLKRLNLQLARLLLSSLKIILTVAPVSKLLKGDIKSNKYVSAN
jgi:hypothetical protein